MRSYIPFHEEGKREVLNTTNVDDCDDLESESKNCEKTGEPLRSGSVFRCSNNHCHAKFLNFHNLLAHDLSQNCYIKKSETIAGHVVREYSQKMGSSKLQRALTVSERRHLPTVLEGELQDIQWSESLSKYFDPMYKIGRFSVGFALRVSNPPTKYNQKQIDYIRRIFLDGEMPNK